MTKKTKQPKPPEPEVLNPRYEGATPAMVARALLRVKPKDEAEDDAARRSSI